MPCPLGTTPKLRLFGGVGGHGCSDSRLVVSTTCWSLLYRAVALLLLSVAPVRCWLSRACLALTAQHRTTKCAGHDCGVVQWYLFRNCGAPNGGAPQLRKSYQYRGVDTIRTPLSWGVTTVFSNLYWYSSSVHLGQQKESTIHTHLF